jgi:hypothetical protein
MSLSDTIGSIRTVVVIRNRVIGSDEDIVNFAFQKSCFIVGCVSVIPGELKPRNLVFAREQASKSQKPIIRAETSQVFEI